MLSNARIKQKEIYKIQQKLIKLYGELKDAQNKMIYAINQSALDELQKANLLKVSVHKVELKQAIKRYTDLYMNVKILENDRDELQNWTPKDEQTDSRD